MNYNVYNIYPLIELSSGVKIHLQSIHLSHTYGGLLCGSPSEHVNDSIISEINENQEVTYFIIKPRVTMLSEDEFFGRNFAQDKAKTIPLLPPVKVHALFESYEEKDSSFLNIAWFQDDFTVTTPSFIRKKIKDIDWYQYACELSL